MTLAFARIGTLFSLALLVPALLQAQTLRVETDSPASKKIWNEYSQVISELHLKFVSKYKTPLTRTSLNQDSANLALVLASKNEVTSLESLGKYDPPPGPIGFCFGRAFATQTYASMQGLKDSSMRKLFIIGDLRSNPARPEWGFHVTTLILGDDQKWYAIDPIYSNPRGKNLPIPASVWIKWVRDNWDRWHKEKPRAFLYLTESSAMMPDVRKFPEGIIDSVKFNQREHGITQDDRITKEFNDPKVFVLTPEQTTEHFLNFSGRREDKNFDFTQLQIQKDVFDFRNYFADFNKTLVNLPAINSALSTSNRWTEVNVRPLGLNFSKFRRP
ncbi:MAG: hypothetical protein K2X47_03295 [Bdellovibrionales bacterium]|nr:hypothetical protein [Bdellovibrionales bacterium]